ncbi:MAG: dihydrofolate reductase [Rhodocyclaceae bacterium]|nr:dihydrofolate reductase [Rhodocyclaceae bacterium]
MTRLSLIAALARNGVIGRDNTLPWRLPDDLKRFKALTLGHPILMGRKTWESLGRPLPGRENVVVTRNPAYQATGCRIVHSLPEAIGACAHWDEVFVIGGGELYAQALPFAHTLYLTEVQAEVEGDARFPDFDRARFLETERLHHAQDETHALAFDFVTYQAIKPTPMSG